MLKKYWQETILKTSYVKSIKYYRYIKFLKQKKK